MSDAAPNDADSALGDVIASVLDDVLRPGLRAVFCGTAASAASGRT